LIVAGAVTARVLAREGRQVGTPDFLLALDHEPEVHRHGPDDLPHGVQGVCLRRGVSLRIGHSPGKELAVLDDGVERRAPPLSDRVDRLHVVVVVEDRWAPGGPRSPHHGRPRTSISRADPWRARSARGAALGFGFAAGADRRHAE
jgi:hypothetical protein